METWSPPQATGTIASLMVETLNQKKNGNLDRKGGKPQCCSLLSASDSKEHIGPPGSQLLQWSRTGRRHQGLRPLLMPSTCQFTLHTAEARGDFLQTPSSGVQLPDMVFHWHISTEQWSQPLRARARIFWGIHLPCSTVSHHLWRLHLAGFGLKMDIMR